MSPETAGALQSMSTPLYSAASNGHKEAVAALIAAKADIEIKSKVWREQMYDLHRLLQSLNCLFSLSMTMHCEKQIFQTTFGCGL
jgi:hypothetical protein